MKNVCGNLQAKIVFKFVITFKLTIKLSFSATLTNIFFVYHFIPVPLRFLRLTKINVTLRIYAMDPILQITFLSSLISVQNILYQTLFLFRFWRRSLSLCFYPKYLLVLILKIVTRHLKYFYKILCIIISTISVRNISPKNVNWIIKLGIVKLGISPSTGYSTKEINACNGL
jgi:hypothetical protein